MKQKCTGVCGEVKEMNAENYYKTHKNQTGFITQCKKCMNKKQKINNAKESSRYNWTKQFIG